ncbi:MAG: hypothetical protein AB1Z55_10120 [Acidimicrobiia bacterium]
MLIVVVAAMCPVADVMDLEAVAAHAAVDRASVVVTVRDPPPLAG